MYILTKLDILRKSGICHGKGKSHVVELSLSRKLFMSSQHEISFFRFERRKNEFEEQKEDHFRVYL